MYIARAESTLDGSQVTYRVPLEFITRVNGVYNDGDTTYKFNIALTGGVQCDKLPVIFLKRTKCLGQADVADNSFGQSEVGRFNSCGYALKRFWGISLIGKTLALHA